MWHALQLREIGSTPPRTVSRHLQSSRIRGIDIARDKEIGSGHRTAVNCLQVDRTEGRYLLSGASNGSLAVYDTQQASKNDVSSGLSQHEALFKVGSHQYSVSSVAWYPIDTGLFISGAFDKRVLVHDTNTRQVEVAFELPGKVHSVAMSSLGLQHTLIAVGTDSPLVRLCDISSGAFTHSLSGHRDAVWAVQWSATSEWVVITGGCDGAIRVWDVRRAGCFSILDHNKSWQAEKQHKATSGRRTTGPPGATPQRVRQNSGGLAQAGAVRKHPGMESETSRATAHNGPITALQTTPDGTFLVSTGGDNRMRLWDIDRGCNMLVNYPGTRISAVKGTSIAVSSDGKRVYLPSGNNIQVYDTWTGQLQGALKGHFEKVNCCVFHPWEQDDTENDETDSSCGHWSSNSVRFMNNKNSGRFLEVYSGSNDRQILVWAPPPAPGDLEGNVKGISETTTSLPNVDAWSDDERHVLPVKYRLQF